MKNIFKNTNLISYLCMIIGVAFLLWKEIRTDKDNQYILIAGLVFLIIGIYQLAKKLPSKRVEDYQEPLIRTEKKQENDTDK